MARPLAILAAGAVLWLAWRQSQASAASAYSTWDDDFMSQAVHSAVTSLGLWQPPAQYADLVAAAESNYGIPSGLLARLLYQESHYRADIISGAKRSPAGALGIAQFMPGTAADWGVDPLDPASAIDGAGRYLSYLYGQLGSWTYALAAYNWGIGNVRRKGIAAAPAETVTYYTSIMADVGLSEG